MSRSASSALIAAALLAIPLVGTSARGAFTTSVVGFDYAAGGAYTYSYTVSNAATSSTGVSEFDVTVDPTANLTSFSSSNNFLPLYTPGDTFVQFLSTDPSTDIAPGTSATFSFVSALNPGNQADLTRGFDPNSGAPSMNAGITVAPVPEPASLALLGLGVVGALGLGARRRRGLAAIAAMVVAAVAAPAAVEASDHADTAANYNRIGADLTDLFIFPNPNNAANVVLVMDAHGLIPAGQSPSFDPQVLYQFKIDNTGDYVEDLVVQFRFVGTGANQQILVSGPAKPAMIGTTTLFGRPSPVVGKINTTTYAPYTGMRVFAGVRSEPFFFDLNQFFAILPDRGTPLQGVQVDNPNGIMGADTPANGSPPGFRGFAPAAGYNSTPAVDFSPNLNVLSIVAEMPKAMLGSGLIHVWMTTGLPTGAPTYGYLQQDRLARPVVNEVFATVTANRHAINNSINPTDDAGQIRNDMLSFMTFPAGRSPATGTTIAKVLIPDTMTADLSQNLTTASYLGYETGGFTGSKFGGRALADDVVDISLGAVFGKTLSALGLVADDGKETPQFTTDNVGPHSDYQSTFPYLGAPH